MQYESFLGLGGGIEEDGDDVGDEDWSRGGWGFSFLGGASGGIDPSGSGVFPPGDVPVSIDPVDYAYNVNSWETFVRREGRHEQEAPWKLWDSFIEGFVARGGAWKQTDDDDAGGISAWEFKRRNVWLTAYEKKVYEDRR